VSGEAKPLTVEQARVAALLMDGVTTQKVACPVCGTVEQRHDPTFARFYKGGRLTISQNGRAAKLQCDQGCDPDEIASTLRFRLILAGALTAAKDIRSERVRWLWDGRIPLRGLVVFAGEKGLGTSRGSSRRRRVASVIDGLECQRGDGDASGAGDQAAPAPHPRADRPQRGQHVILRPTQAARAARASASDTGRRMPPRRALRRMWPIGLNDEAAGLGAAGQSELRDRLRYAGELVVAVVVKDDDRAVGQPRPPCGDFLKHHLAFMAAVNEQQVDRFGDVARSFSAGRLDQPEPVAGLLGEHRDVRVTMFMHDRIETDDPAGWAVEQERA
jgi:hypothetical protein